MFRRCCQRNGFALQFPLGRGQRIDSRTATTNVHLSPEDVCMCTCVGIVSRPQIALLNGVSMWQCKLLVSQVGCSATDVDARAAYVFAQDGITLKSFGSRWTSFAKQHLCADSMVTVRGQIVQRPKFVAIHSTYRYDSELYVSDACGFISKVR